MRNNRDTFNKSDYNKADPAAKKAMVGWLLKNIPDLIINDTENYGFDIRAYTNGGPTKYFYEVEIKHGWKDEWPESWTELRIPFRKKRLLVKWEKEHPDDEFTFVVFRHDLKKAWHVPAHVVSESEVKEASNKNVRKGELFFHIPVDQAYQVDMTYGNSNS